MEIEKLENIEKNANMLIIGKRGIGKTSFIISLLQGKKYSQGNIFCLDHENDRYKDGLPLSKLNFYNELTEKTLNDIITKCTDSSFIVIEDSFNIKDINLNYLETFKKHNITLIAITQYMCINIFDYIVLFKTTNMSNIREIYKKIDTKMTFENFEKTMNELDRYSPLIYNKVDEDVHWYKI
ncbi:P-loop NTPase domain protein [Hokovirus HKV1]|uniref:p-loop NTPase domain protein n=1 Tax=Hokovirus HKV1 TaxID=1977638 RepID=A0A1V0SEL7_9VIRU|nr:P-loop NTPase domain protein [Hokovirus HKV1]